MDQELLTYSDLYREDVPQGALFIPHSVTSSHDYREGQKVPTILCNDQGRFNAFDHMVKPSGYSYKVTPQRHTAVTGSFLSVYAETKPCDSLVEHWKRKLGIKGSWKWGSPGEVNQPHIVSFPMEHLADDLHAVDPDVHYKLISKCTIPQLTTFTPRVQDRNNPCYPCVVKMTIGSGRKGVFFAYNDENICQITNKITQFEPKASVIVTDMVQNIVGNYCCVVYVSQKGHGKWLGVSETFFDSNDRWGGAHIDISAQFKLINDMRPTVDPIIDKMQEFGYFGVVGIDVLVDRSGVKYVPDVNPRITGSTPSLLISKLMAGRGWLFGTYTYRADFKGTTEQLIQQAEDVDDGEVVILGLTEWADGVSCGVAIFAKSADKCQEYFAKIFT